MSSSVTPQGLSAKRSSSRNRRPSSRPTTPLRPSSRSSFRDGYNGASLSAADPGRFPLDALQPAFLELSESIADLETNFEHLQMMHHSLARFSESFASFLYGLNMNAFCVDFPEVRIPAALAASRGHRLTGEDRPRLPTRFDGQRCTKILSVGRLRR
jgi:DASH complex subunit DAM1